MLRLDGPEVAHACPEDNALLSIAKGSSLSMWTEYLTAALESAHFEIIEDAEPLYGQIPALKGAWATGPTLEECRRNLAPVSRLGRPLGSGLRLQRSLST